ncbi:hypothetical protein UlMin_006927 [Ulmus minor]
MSGGNNNINSVFYAESYHPIQAGSIDGTDILPHDNAVYRAHLCSSAALYDPFGDPKLIGDPYSTLFVARLSPQTTDHTLRMAFSKYGRVKNLRLVRHIVTGASRGYAFVEFETEREMRRAYKDAHHSIIDDCEIIVDYNRQQLMPGWIPRRLGGGLGGKKESGQLRFGGRERPFRAPLRPIPYDELKRLGIPAPPEGKYMSRYQIPSPPRRERSLVETEEGSHRRSTDRDTQTRQISPVDKEERYSKRSPMDREDPSHKISKDKGDHYIERTSMERDDYPSTSIEREENHHKRKSRDREDYRKKSYKDRDDRHSHKRHKFHRPERSSSTGHS